MNPCVRKLVCDLVHTYGNTHAKTLDVGSYDLSVSEDWNFTGNVRAIFTGEYVGMDIREGPNVDLIVADPLYWVEIDSESFDQVVSVCCLEHASMPWVVLQECYRVTRAGGLSIHVAPWRWRIHRWPEDCWRILPDGMRHTLEWAGFEVLDVDIACKSKMGEMCYGVGRKN